MGLRISFCLKGSRKGAAKEKQPENTQRSSVLAEHRESMEGFTGAVRPMAKRIQPIWGMDKSWSIGR